MTERRCLYCKCLLRSGNLGRFCSPHRNVAGHLDAPQAALARHEAMMLELSEERVRLSDTSKLPEEDEDGD